MVWWFCVKWFLGCVWVLAVCLVWCGELAGFVILMCLLVAFLAFCCWVVYLWFVGFGCGF